MCCSLSQNFFCRGYDALGEEAELLEQILQRGGSAESVHPNGFALGSDVALPTSRRGHFDGDARRSVGRKHACTISGVLFLKKLPGGHAHDAGLDALGLELFVCFDAQMDFATSGHENYVGLAVCGGGENIG